MMIIQRYSRIASDLRPAGAVALIILGSGRRQHRTFNPLCMNGPAAPVLRHLDVDESDLVGIGSLSLTLKMAPDHVFTSDSYKAGGLLNVSTMVVDEARLAVIGIDDVGSGYPTLNYRLFCCQGDHWYTIGQTDDTKVAISEPLVGDGSVQYQFVGSYVRYSATECLDYLDCATGESLLTAACSGGSAGDGRKYMRA